MAWEHLRSTYDTVASKYEARFVDELRDKPHDRALLLAFAESSTDPVVEIGCGPGQIGAFVGARGRRVVGLDLSSNMARLAAVRLGAALIADMRELPFVTGQLGGVLAFYSLIHLRRAEVGGVLREIQRVLRPGGAVLFSAHEGDGEVVLEEFIGERVPLAATFFTLDELVDASRDAGFDVTSATRREPYESESTLRLYVAATKPD